jgi:imidazolonepropionase-like amidohydrolase
MLPRMPRTLLAGGSVFDVGSGEVVLADVAFEGDRIVDVGLGLDGDTIVDCRGGLLVPGFIDCHTHIAVTHDDPYGTPRSARILSAVPILRTLLRLGVTTVRDAWGADAGLALALAKGWIEGPDLIVSLRQVCTTGGSATTGNPARGR